MNITTRKYYTYTDSKVVSCLDVSISNDNETLEHGFIFYELGNLKTQLLAFIYDIDQLLEHEKVMEDIKNPPDKENF